MAWFVVAGIDTAVSAVVSAVVDLAGEANVIETNLESIVFRVVKVLSVVSSLNEKVFNNTSRLFWPSSLVDTPLLSRWVSGSALLELVQWDDFVVLDNVIKVFESTLNVHALDGSADAVSFLVGNGGIVVTRLANLFIARLERILPCHLPKEVEWG